MIIKFPKKKNTSIASNTLPIATFAAEKDNENNRLIKLRQAGRKRQGLFCFSVSKQYGEWGDRKVR